jgi:hypothetical protein
VSDFEDGTTTARFGAGWSISTGAAGEGSKAEMTVVEDGADGSKRALRISGDIASGDPHPWPGAMFSPGPETMAPVDLSAKKAISFWAKGDGKRHRILVFAHHRGSEPLVDTFAAGPEWARHAITIGSFDGIDGRDLQAVVFAGGPQAGPFAFLIDDVRIE